MMTDAIPPHQGAVLPSLTMTALREAVEQNATRIAALGGWPAWIDIAAALTGRLPADGQKSRGFDAGIACALGLLPPHAQKLSAALHAAYTPATIAEIGRDIDRTHTSLKDSNSPTAWWLAACSLCVEGEQVDEALFKKQITAFQRLAENPAERLKAANTVLKEMLRSFDTARGYAFGEHIGCQQGAYIAGHPFAVLHDKSLDAYFIGTFHASLGLEKFHWSGGDNGPVRGSRQFVRCATENEMERAVREIMKAPPFSRTPRKTVQQKPKL